MAFSPETYALCLKNTAEKIDEALTSVYNYKGSVDTIADLPLTNNKVGDTYDVKSEGGQNYGWNGESWDSLGVNREATDTDLGLIKKKNNTFNTTTFVGDMTAINSNNTSITGSGITSVNGEGNFEVSKPTTIIASKTTNITGNGMTSVNGEGSFEVTKPTTVIASDTTNIGGFKLNINGGYVNISSTDVNIAGDQNVTITSNREPIKITSSLNVEGSATFNRTVQAKNFTDEKVALDVHNDGDIGNIFLGGVKKATSGTTRTYNLVLNNYTGPYPTTLSNNATGNLCIGNSNTLNGDYNTVLGISNFTIGNYSFVKGQNNVANALGSTIFGSNSRTDIGAEYGLVSGMQSSVNGKAASVLGDNLLGSRETGSMTIGTFNKNKDAMFAVGNGNQSSSSVITRSNAFEVYKNGDAVIQNNLTVGGTINASSLKNIPVWTLDDIQKSDEPVNIFKYFLGNNYNELTTCNRWFIVMPQSPHQFFIGRESKQGVTLNLSSLGEMHLLYFIKASEKWTITLYNITGKLNESSTKSIPTIEVRSFVEDELGNFSALTTIPTFVTSVSGMMDADYNPSSDRHIITMKYLNTRIQELLDNEISSKITEELNKINVAENKN